MPIYEYLCKKCGEFEVTQRITEPTLERCPHCRSKVRKLISTTSFQLKGSGWYITDYARKGSAAKEAKPSTSSAPSDSPSTAASSSKPDSAGGPAKEASAAA